MTKHNESNGNELIIAHKELAFQIEEKEKLVAELIIVNKELAFQNEEKEKRAAELSIANKELLAFTYISSHDLQEPLRKIQTFVSIILENEDKNLSDGGKYNFQRMQLAAGRMQQLIDDLLAFSRINTTDHK
jgi:light-regulated signal transduction histidine kinase (bacteriophytochrome)